MASDPIDDSSRTPIAPMAHGDLHRLTLPLLLRKLPVTANGRPRVLDLGAGSGRMSQLLHAAGYSPEACDLDPALFQFPAINCRRADLTERLPYEDESFDGIVCLEVLEHLDGHERIFRELERLLKPGGILLFTTPNVMSIKSRLSFLWTGFRHSYYPLEIGRQTPAQRHISGYGGNRYRFMLGLAGLELREVRCDKFSRTSLAFAWLVPLIWLRSWLRHRGAAGARLNNSLAALLGRTMVGVAVKPAPSCAPMSSVAGQGSNEVATPVSAHGDSSGRRTRSFVANGLSVIIPCKNERQHIRACIASAKQVADEVLVADSGSTDGTREIAREAGCRVIEREYGTSGEFKNWAIPQAAHEWVLVLDADERVTSALAAEIRRVLAAPRHEGYWIYRRNHFLGHPIRFGPWKNDRCLRLFRRNAGRYVGATDHAEVALPCGTAGRLRERLTHYTCTSYGQYLPKLARYADVQSRLWHGEGRRTHAVQLLLRFPLRFLQGYVGRLGFLDGLAGLQVCLLVAHLSYLKHAYLWQLQHSRDWRALERSSMDARLPLPTNAEETDEDAGRTAA